MYKPVAQGLLVAGERFLNLAKAFNSRLGFRREDDTVCHRRMNEPMADGDTNGMMPRYLEQAKDE